MFSCCAVFLLTVIVFGVKNSKAATSCIPATPPNFGFVDGCAGGNSCPLGTKVNFTCSEGYKLIGPDSITCEPITLVGRTFGSWSALAPICFLDIDHCAQLGEISNGNITDCYNRACLYGTEVRISCNEGFVLRGGAAIICQKATNDTQATWSSFKPYCSPIGSFSIDDVFYALFGNLVSQ